MEIFCLIEINDKNINSYTTAYKTLADTITTIELSTKLYMVLYTTEYITVNLSEILRNTPIGKCTTWDEIETALTLTLVISYQVTINTQPTVKTINEAGKVAYISLPYITPMTQELKTHSCLTHPGIEVSYGNSLSPTLRNIKSLRWKLTDLVLTKLNNNPIVESLNFNNCLPVVNGIIHYPVIYNNEMYIKSSTINLTSTYDLNKEILLLDTSNLGDMEIIKFSDCVMEVKDNYSNRMKFILPNGSTMCGKTPILIVAGRMFFRHEFYQPNDTTLLVDQQILHLRKIGIKNKFIRGIYKSGTTTIVNSNTIAEHRAYFSNTDITDTFIVLIDTPNVRVTTTYPLQNIDKNSCRFTTDTKGLMMLTSTRDILNYTTIKYQSTDLMSYTLPTELYYLTHTEQVIEDTAFLGCNVEPDDLVDINNQRVKLVRLSLP